MKLIDAVQLLERGKRRYHIVGTPENGTLIALDVEGRLYAFLNGEILNRVNPEPFCNYGTRTGYLNPGGDGIWPAPEGSRLGYEYSTGAWRVPPSLTGSHWHVVEQGENSAYVEAEIDLINAEGRGIPCLFSRKVSLEFKDGAMVQKVTEGIQYLGTEPLTQEQALLAPWSLCQFDCNEDCKLLLPPVPASEIWDLYTPESSCHRKDTAAGIEVAMKTDFRFQLGLSPLVQGLEFVDFRRNFKAKRIACPLADGFSYIDIADQDPANEPNGRPVRFSAYCDPSGFMEIEAAGGVPALLTPNAISELHVETTYSQGICD